MNSLKKLSSLAKDKWTSDKVLISEWEGSCDAALEIDPLEDCPPITIAVRSDQSLRLLSCGKQNSVLMLDIITLDPTDQSAQRSLRLIVPTFFG